MKRLFILTLMLALPLGCGTLYKSDRPESEVPKEEIKRDKIECHNYAELECAKAANYGKCYRIYNQKCLSDRGWHKEKRR